MKGVIPVLLFLSSQCPYDVIPVWNGFVASHLILVVIYDKFM
ncbi:MULTISPECIES: hypothetical protein [Wolbachia]|nr:MULTISPECIES: hypothetical protein [Wolbachia]